MAVGLQNEWNDNLTNPESEAFTNLKAEVMQTMGFDRLEETMPGVPIKDVDVQFSLAGAGLERGFFGTVADITMSIALDKLESGVNNVADIISSVITITVHLLPDSWTLEQTRMKFQLD